MSQYVYLDSDLDPNPVAVSMAQTWGEVVVKKVPLPGNDDTGDGWRWQITGHWRIPSA